MDACLMAAQLLAHCATSTPEQDLGEKRHSGAATVVIPQNRQSLTLSAIPTVPETHPATVKVAPPPETSALCATRGGLAQPNPARIPCRVKALDDAVMPVAGAAVNPVSADIPSIAATPAWSIPARTMVSATQSRSIPSLPLLPNPFEDGSLGTGRSPSLPRDTAPPAMALPQGAALARPASGSQMYRFRLAALRAGELYTRASPSRYVGQWQRETSTPTHANWQALLAQEAAIMAASQGHNRLTVMVGDSLALWLPSEQLPRHQFWLNQSISGETTAHILNRLDYFAHTRPNTIQLMAGINDLKNGASDQEVLQNMHQILTRLRQQHPQAHIVVYSILPTRWENLPSDRIHRVNDYIAYVAAQQGATFVDLQANFADAQGQLRPELTTDGLHLSRQGYEVWQAAMPRD
ncbi:MAG: GDSL-type esterase/lipase family protein [Nodosilinea sp.]